MINKQQTQSKSRRSHFKEIAPQLLKEFEAIEQNFVSMMVKLNPAYHLLHSPLTSLKGHQKELLIHNLTQNYKDKLKEIATILFNKQQEIRERTKMTFSLEEAMMSIEEMTRKIEEKSFQITLLKEKLEEQNVLVSELQSINSSTQQVQSIRQKYSNQEELEEKIRLLHQRNIKKQHFGLLMYKARQLKQLKYIKIVNKNQENHFLKNQYFNQLKQLVECTRNQRMVCQIKTKRQAKNFYLILKINSIFEKSCACLNKYFKSKRYRQFSISLRKNYSQREHLKVKTTKFITKIQDRKIKSVFNFLRRQIQESQNVKDESLAKVFQRRIYLKRYFRQWLIANKIFTIKEAEVKIFVKDRKRRYVLNKFSNIFRKEIDFHIKSYGLSLFIHKYRIISSFHAFYKSISSTLFQRQINFQKIVKHKKHKYFNYFFNTIKDKMLNKTIKTKRQMQVFAVNIEKKKIAMRGVRGNYKELLRRIYNKKIMVNLKEQFKEVFICKNRQMKMIKQFYSNFKSCYISKLKMQNKCQMLLQRNFIGNKVIHFYQNLKILQKDNLKQNLNTLLKEKCLQKIFYKWKQHYLIKKIEDYRLRFDEIGIDIEVITEKQRETSSERILLIRELDDRGTQLRILKKKMDQYEVLLQSKEVKYEKLKNLFADSVAMKDNYSRKTPLYEIGDYRKSPERDYDYDQTATPYQKFYQEEAQSAHIFSTFKRF